MATVGKLPLVIRTSTYSHPNLVTGEGPSGKVTGPALEPNARALVFAGRGDPVEIFLLGRDVQDSLQWESPTGHPDKHLLYLEAQYKS